MGKIVKGMVSSMDFVWWEMENVKHENFNYFLGKKRPRTNGIRAVGRPFKIIGIFACERRAGYLNQGIEGKDQIQETFVK